MTEDLQKSLDTFSAAAWDRWGGEAQVIMAIEEAGELISALAKLLNKRGDMKDGLVSVAEELADVTITTRQLILKLTGEDLFELTLERKLLKANRYLETIDE